MIASWRGLLPSMPDDKGKEVPRSSPLSLYTVQKFLMSP